MTVQFQSYNTETSWSPAELADIFQEAFIDAGLLPPTGWYDSNTVGALEHRIMELQHDPARTYGTTYYWFIFTTNRIYFHFCTAWDTDTKLPGGVGVGVDHPFYVAPTNDTIARHSRVYSPSQTITFQVVRYTSSIDPDFTIFVLKNGTTESWWYFHTGAPNPSFCDLDQSCYMGLYSPVNWVRHNNGGITATFALFGVWIRRYFLGGSTVGANGFSNLSYAGYLAQNFGFDSVDVNSLMCRDGRFTHAYHWPIQRLSSLVSQQIGGWPAICLPFTTSVVNPAAPSEYASPIFTNIPYSMYSPVNIPGDFGLAATYTNNTISTFDKYIVTPGTNEWEVIRASNGTRDGSQNAPTLMLLARTA